MKASWFIVFIAIFISIYAGVNYYIGYRGWQAFVSNYPLINSKIYWLLFWLISLSYIIARLTKRFLPSIIGEGLTLIGSYWMAAMVYFIIILLIIDIIRLIDKWVTVIPDGLKNSPITITLIGLTFLGLVTALLIYGTWNAKNPVVKHYDVKINKRADSLSKLHIVMVSDIHLGTLIRKARLIKMVNQINELHPDIVLMAGDIIDEDIDEVIKQNMAEDFRKLKAKYGVYAVFGNHENIGGQGNKAADYLSQGGIVVLQDDYVKIADSFYVIGRKDMSSSSFSGNKRKALSQLIAGVDTSLPLILLDHQPSKLKEPEKAGIDLQLSGHTHSGQFFPINLFTKAIYEKDYGYLKKNNLQLIVSSGYGTWGPPIRIGNKPEIVDISVDFKK